jgi:hypothetical protein
MATPRLSHNQREQAVLADLETSFPNFAGQSLSWTKVPDGQDPPDFRSSGPCGPIGLELREWLDGNQMGPAKGRESQRDQIHHVLANNWESEYRPQNFCAASISPRLNARIAPTDQGPLRQEFFACSAYVDRSWLTNAERTGNAYYQTKFPGFPFLAKYINSIRYIKGEPHGLCWIHEQGDGGAYDPAVTFRTLEQALDGKLSDYSTPERQGHLKAHGLGELFLLVHGGFDAYAYNTPSAPLSLEEIAQRGGAFYAAHPQRQIFARVWFFDSLDSAHEINQLLGYPPGYGRVRWLAQLWPTFYVYAGSSPPLTGRRGHGSPVSRFFLR